jgi:DNA-binding MarR family transcriptional regulator
MPRDPEPAGNPPRTLHITWDPPGLRGGERKVLEALIQHPDGLSRAQLTVLTGYKRSSRDTYIQRLAARGYAGTDAIRVFATDAGRQAMPDARALPTGTELQEYWLARLGAGEAKILRALLDAYPDLVTKEQLSEQTGYKRSSRDTYLQRLAARSLIEPRMGEVRAAPTLFGDRI